MRTARIVIFIQMQEGHANYIDGHKSRTQFLTLECIQAIMAALRKDDPQWTSSEQTSG